MNDNRAFLLGHAQAANWQDAVAACLQQLNRVPAAANFGFVYVTDAYADVLPSILERLRSVTGIDHWSGTVGIGICATEKEYHRASAMAVLICSFPADSFRMLPFYNRPADRLPASWESWLRKSSAHVGVLHGDPANSMLPELLKQLQSELPGGYLVGGLSSSHGAHPQIAGELLDGGLSGVVFNAEVNIATALSQGCSPIGTQHVITNCDGNVVNDIDRRPALDVFNEDIGEILARDLNRVAGYIFAGLPTENSDTGDYLVRNLIGIDTESRRIAIGDMLHPGQKLQFCRRDGKTAGEDMQRMLDELKTRTGGMKPRGGLYFSCLGRGEALFGENSAEVKMISDTLGNFPLVGFFANGEIFNQRLYGYTGVLTLFM
jgi:small ligand-binding sensory domain FIST